MTPDPIAPVPEPSIPEAPSAPAVPAVAPVAAPAAAPAAPAPRAETVILAVAWPLTSFDPGIPGCPLITQAGTEVPLTLASQVEERAQAARLSLERRS